MNSEIIRIVPNIKLVQKDVTCIIISPLLIIAIRRQPKNVPVTVPVPPSIDVPPIITAAIMVSSEPDPIDG